MALKIYPKYNETPQQLLRRFKKMIEKDGLINDIKKAERYEKPSEKQNRIKRKKIREIEKLAKLTENKKKFKK